MRYHKIIKKQTKRYSFRTFKGVSGMLFVTLGCFVVSPFGVQAQEQLQAISQEDVSLPPQSILQTKEKLLQEKENDIDYTRLLEQEAAGTSSERDVDPVPLGLPANVQENSGDPALGLQFRRVENVDNTLLAPDIDAEHSMSEEEKAAEAMQKRYDKAFDQAQQGMFPLRPEEIARMLRLFNITRETGETAERSIPTPEVKVASISLDPSVAPETIKTAPGHVTSLTILDVSGRPWPVQDVSWAGKFEVVPPESQGHVIRITPLSAHGIGNMSIRLIGLPTPVTFRLMTGSDVVHYRFDARIPEYGPNADIPIIQGAGIMAGGALLTSILDGAPPQEAVRLQVSGVDGRTSVWRVHNNMYVRTPFTLLSPGWKESANSADGMRVYAVGEAPVLLLSDGGDMIRAVVGKEESVDVE